jgi:hypothetical protein
VSRQHIDLYQGGQHNELQVEAAKERFRVLLERGEVAAIEASMRPGMQYVVQVRALAEIGTDDAGRILERQLGRRLSEDQLEQSWYWIDLANGLRCLNREESLPHLLRCAEPAGEMPLGHFFAAETVCFLGFAGYLAEPGSSLGSAALRLLHRTLEGLRLGVPPQLVIEARLGEALERLWDHRPEQVDPLVVRVFAESRRVLQRAAQLQASLSVEGAEREAFDLQMSRLAVLEPALTEYLDEARTALCQVLADAEGDQLRDTLLALHDLRAEAADGILPLLLRPSCPFKDIAVEVLTWSRDPRVGPFLREWALRRVQLQKRIQLRRRPLAARRLAIPPDFPYRNVLRALRGHPAVETEIFLMIAANDHDPNYRRAALSSLGWWEPIRGKEVRNCLQQARRDPYVEVRQAARAALARLGERQALHWFRQALASEDLQQVLEAIHVVAHEGLTLLWPDLDRLADADDPDMAHHAREAVSVLFEEMERR